MQAYSYILGHVHMYMPQKTERRYSYVLYNIRCEHEGINTSSKIKSSVHCGAAGNAFVLITSYYYGLLLQKDVADIMDCGEM